MFHSPDVTVPCNETAQSTEDDLQLERKFTERVGRVQALVDLDTVLTAAANRHSLAAQVVHFGWPHRAD